MQLTIQHLREDVRRLVRFTVCVEQGEPCLADALPHPEWESLVRSGGGDMLVGGAVVGAVEALRLRAVGAPDVLSCPCNHRTVDTLTMSLAVGWVASARYLRHDPLSTQSMVTQAMARYGWKSSPRRSADAILAISVVALYAAARRSSSPR